MTGLWIRVAANIGDRKVVWRLVTSCGLSVDAAVGTLVMFWGAVAASTKGGRIDDVSDVQLEAWARWQGEPGAFARFVREQHATDGVINEWDDYAGTLEDRRERDRERKRREREAKKSAGNPQDVRVTSVRTERNGTERLTTPPPPPRDSDAAMERETALLDALPPLSRNAFTTLLARVKGHRMTWVAEIAAARDGMHGKAYSLTEIGQALVDMVANGAHEHPNLRQFRRYLAGTRDVVTPGARPNGNGKPKGPPQTYTYGDANGAAAEQEIVWTDTKAQ